MKNLTRFTAINPRMGSLPVMAARVSAELHQVICDVSAQVILVCGRFINQILPDSTDTLLTREQVNSLREVRVGSRVILIVDLSSEGYKYGKILSSGLRHLINLMRDVGFVDVSVVFVQTNYALAGDFAVQKSEIEHVHFFNYHFYLDGFLRFCVRDKIVNRGIGNLNRVPSKAVLCLNHRPRYHRLYCILWVMKHFGVDNASVTLGEWQVNHSKAAMQAIVERLFPNLPTYDEVSEDVRKITSDLRLLVETKPSELAMSIERNLYQETFGSLVTETEMETPNMCRYTEKILKPLVMAHPFVAAANKGTVAKMEELGFDVLSDEIDHAYDNIDDPEARLTSALRSADALFKRNQGEQVAFLKRTQSRLAANVRQFDGRLLKKLTQEWEAELLTIITTQLQRWIRQSS
ncbi:MAG: hypothetical protein ROR55_27945 [Devosia sp.]